MDDKIASGARAVTLAGYLSTLAKVLDWAQHSRRIAVTGDIARNSRAALSHAGHRTRSNERARVPAEGELSRLYAYWEKQLKRQIHMPELVRFAIASAMRQGEICYIRFENEDRSVVSSDVAVDVAGQREAMTQLEKDITAIQVITDGIVEGHHKRTQLLDYCKAHQVSKRKFEAVIKRYCVGTSVPKVAPLWKEELAKIGQSEIIDRLPKMTDHNATLLGHPRTRSAAPDNPGGYLKTSLGGADRVGVSY